jgi:hypothetical protein
VICSLILHTESHSALAERFAEATGIGSFCDDGGHPNSPFLPAQRDQYSNRAVAKNPLRRGRNLMSIMRDCDGRCSLESPDPRQSFAKPLCLARFAQVGQYCPATPKLRRITRISWRVCAQTLDPIAPFLAVIPFQFSIPASPHPNPALPPAA